MRCVCVEVEIQSDDADDAHGDNMADVPGRMELRQKTTQWGRVFNCAVSYVSCDWRLQPLLR